MSALHQQPRKNSDTSILALPILIFTRLNSVMPNPTLERGPKRVILRLRVNDFDGQDPSSLTEAISEYIAFAGRSTTELQENRHYAHIEPFQSPELQQASFHITLDIDKDSVQNPNLTELPHEIYRVRRDVDGKL